MARAPANIVNGHRASLYNITDAALEVAGGPSAASSGNFGSSDSRIIGRFTIAAQKVFEIQHRCVTTSAADVGFGDAISSDGYVEVFADVQIWKVG